MSDVRFTRQDAAVAPAGLRRLVHRLGWVGPLLAVVPVAAAMWWVQTFNPTTGREGPMGPCAWHLLTGINGPGCGGTRAFYYLLHGDLVGAVRFHLPAVMAVPVLAYWWLRWMLDTTTGLRLPALRPRPALLAAYGVFFLLFTVVLRNLPVPPFHWFDIPNTAHRLW